MYCFLAIFLTIIQIWQHLYFTLCKSAKDFLYFKMCVREMALIQGSQKIFHNVEQYLRIFFALFIQD